MWCLLRLDMWRVIGLRIFCLIGYVDVLFNCMFAYLVLNWFVDMVSNRFVYVVSNLSYWFAYQWLDNGWSGWFVSVLAKWM